jgi:hypothetical protein
MVRGVVFAWFGALSVVAVAEGCGSSSASAVPGCTLGAACSTAQVCMGGIAGCTSNCQCLGGTWQAPCPQDAPRNVSACTAENATCGYLTQAIACEGSVDCDCHDGVWSCGPTCVTAPDAAPDRGPSDAAADSDAHDAGSE